MSGITESMFRWVVDSRFFFSNDVDKKKNSINQTVESLNIRDVEHCRVSSIFVHLAKCPDDVQSAIRKYDLLRRRLEVLPAEWMW